MRLSPSSTALCLILAAFAQGAPAEQTLEEVPEAAPASPKTIEDGQELEPDVTIVQRKDATVEEYRLNGRLYMVKVIPFIGPPYYLMDNDGDGVLEKRIGELKNDPVVPQWVIFSW